MELIWVLWFIFGLIMGVLISVLVEREHDNDSDIRVYVPNRDRDRSGDNGRDEQMDEEEVIIGLQNLRMALSGREQEYLDYALKCVQTIQRLQRMVDEGRLGDDN